MTSVILEKTAPRVPASIRVGAMKLMTLVFQKGLSQEIGKLFSILCDSPKILLTLLLEQGRSDIFVLLSLIVVSTGLEWGDSCAKNIPVSPTNQLSFRNAAKPCSFSSTISCRCKDTSGTRMICDFPVFYLLTKC